MLDRRRTLMILPLLALVACSGGGGATDDAGSAADLQLAPDQQLLLGCDGAASGCALVLVDVRRFGELEAELMAYLEAVQQQLAVGFEVLATEEYESQSPEQIRALLQQAHEQHQIQGALLVGRMPYALWEHDWDGDHRGVNSFYYEDLDGTWSDSDGDGYHDLHGWGQNEGPEIWVSWLYPSSAGATEELLAFFRKARAYHQGQSPHRKRGLVFIHSDWAQDMGGHQNYYGQLLPIYGADNIDRRGGYDGAGKAILVNGFDYLELINETYETAVVYTHANSQSHYTDMNPVHRTAVAAAGGGGVITFIGGCHSGDVKQAGAELALVPTYVFQTRVGLAATGTTWSYGPEELAQVTSRLQQGMSLGRAWLAKQAIRNTPDYYEQRYAVEGKGVFDASKHMFGEILFGDPFVTLQP